MRLGFQAHLVVGKIPPAEEILANLRRFHDLGVEIWITELDLRVKVPTTAEDLARQAQEYASLVRVCVESGAVRSIQTWGLDDGHSWVPFFFGRLRRCAASGPRPQAEAGIPGGVEDAERQG